MRVFGRHGTVALGVGSVAEPAVLRERRLTGSDRVRGRGHRVLHLLPFIAATGILGADGGDRDEGHTETDDYRRKNTAHLSQISCCSLKRRCSLKVSLESKKTSGILTQPMAHCKAVLRYTALTVPTTERLAAARAFLLLATLFFTSLFFTSVLSATTARAALGTLGPQQTAATPADPATEDPTIARLFDGAMLGNVADVRAAIAARVPVDQTNDSRMTALGVAALYGRTDVVAALIAAGANVNANQDGESALALAAQAGHVPVVDALLAAHADITAKDKDGMTALMAAAAANRAAVLRTLIAHGADVNAANPDGATALMAAAFGGHVEAAQALLGAGANVNSRDTVGRTPLMAAALGGSAAIARTLLDRKADLNAEDQGGSTALIYAAANGHLEFIDLLVKAGLTKGSDMALAYAVRGCFVGVMQRLLDGGAKTTAQLQGTPMLVLAASSNCLDAIDVLLARGADVNVADEDGTTALMHAAELGFVSVVQRLLDKGADLERTNKDRQSAWLFAAMGNQLEVVDIFKAYRAAHPTEPR